MAGEHDMMNDPREIRKLIFERTERLKELAAINQTNDILREGKPADETLQQLARLFPAAWQYPEYTCCRITFGSKSFASVNFFETKWLQHESFETIEGKHGSIEIYYLREFMQFDEGPFLKEERHLIVNLASAITGYLNSIAARDLLKKARITEGYIAESKTKESAITGKQLLQRFLNKNNYDRDVYHDLQPFKVKEILLVANL